MSRIQESEYGSLRKIAEHIQTHRGKPMAFESLSRTLSGQRELSLIEARQLANLLRVPMSEIIRRMGIPFGVRDNVEGRADRRSVK